MMGNKESGAVKPIAIFALLATSVSALIAIGLRVGEPDEKRYPVRGVDVSHHQGRIEWDQLRAQGVSFVFIKATEGTDHLDTRFHENWDAAGRIGLVRGPYHFFTFCSPGGAQAEHFLATVPTDSATLPAAVDIEFAGNCKNWPGVEAVRKELQVFLAAVGAAQRAKPILYVTREAYRRIIAGHFLDHRLWVRNTLWRPWLGFGRSWLFWQYSDKGELKGVSGPIDFNVFDGDQHALSRLLPDAPALPE